MIFLIVSISKNIKVNLTFLLDLSTLKMKIYEFARILGILLDNAIEASSECDEKIINITFRDDSKHSRQLGKTIKSLIICLKYIKLNNP